MGVLQVCAMIVYVCIGFLQFFAIVDGIEAWLDIPHLLALLVAVFMAWFPLVGQILGFFSAWMVWDWHFFGAFALFFWPLILGLIAFFSLVQRRP